MAQWVKVLAVQALRPEFRALLSHQYPKSQARCVLITPALGGKETGFLEISGQRGLSVSKLQDPWETLSQLGTQRKRQLVLISCLHMHIHRHMHLYMKPPSIWMQTYKKRQPPPYLVFSYCPSCWKGMVLICLLSTITRTLTVFLSDINTFIFSTEFFLWNWSLYGAIEQCAEATGVSWAMNVVVELLDVGSVHDGSALLAEHLWDNFSWCQKIVFVSNHPAHFYFKNGVVHSSHRVGHWRQSVEEEIDFTACTLFSLCLSLHSHFIYIHFLLCHVIFLSKFH